MIHIQKKLYIFIVLAFFVTIISVLSGSNLISKPDTIQEKQNNSKANVQLTFVSQVALPQQNNEAAPVVTYQNFDINTNSDYKSNFISYNNSKIVTDANGNPLLTKCYIKAVYLSFHPNSRFG